MVGGIFTSFLLELLVYPVVYLLWKWHYEVKPTATREQPDLSVAGSEQAMV
jgi:Cu(I)/Ag(I) efflux system membrane protein CusA/SilA